MEQDLIRDYLRGKSAAVRRIARWIDGELLTHRYGDPQEREDLHQVVHQKLIDNLSQHRFRARASLRTYIARIVRFTVIDRLRRTRSAVPIEVSPEPIDPQDPHRLFERRERVAILRLALRDCPSGCLALWYMHYVEGLGCREIGKKLGIPIGTVKSRLWACRRRLAAGSTRSAPGSGRHDRLRRRAGAPPDQPL